MEVLLYTILSLCALGVLAAVVLYFVAQKFRVEEDPRIDEVEKMLPGANCGGCGFAGCRGMADALVKRDDISELFCPVGGGDCMKAVAAYLGKAAAEKQPEVATVRCGGTCEKRPRTNQYDGARSCAVASSLYVGESACAFGCLGFGDCVVACAFDAIHINPAILISSRDSVSLQYFSHNISWQLHFRMLPSQFQWFTRPHSATIVFSEFQHQVSSIIHGNRSKISGQAFSRPFNIGFP